MAAHFTDRVVERATDVVAVAGVTSPLWLQDISNLATALLPILGCVWLAYQIYTHWSRKKNGV